MVLGVWGNHTRLLLPSTETQPSNWKTWTEGMGTVVYRRWDNWEVSPPQDATRVALDLSPCRLCARNVRIPSVGDPRYAGVNWWEQWNPCSHLTDTTPTTMSQRWGCQPQRGESQPTTIGRGILPEESSANFGLDYLPDCTDQWRAAGPCAESVTQ